MSATAPPVVTQSAAVTGTVGQLVSTAISIAAPAASRAAAQSILDKPHESPARYNPNDPIVLFIIQASLVIILSRVIGLGLSRLRQPRVVSEVIAGIILGPSIMGRIPGFSAKIFPPQSIPYLNLVSNIGLVLFLFIVGLEVDFTVFKRNAKSAIGVSVVGLLIPFGCGAAISVGIYNKFVDETQVSFGHFLLFIAVAMAITAFPVLARILTECNLMQTDVGLTTLAAGVANDVVGWILLALAVALSNAGSGTVAVYILLTAIGWALFLWFAVRPAFHLGVNKQSGAGFDDTPSQLTLTMLLIIVFASAFVTQIIGIHAIFGGFLAGCIVVPRHAGFIEQIILRIEDLVSILLLPVYFALSGLKTDLGLLNNGSIWAYVFAVIIVAFVSKFGACMLAAKWTGFLWRESAAIGTLMSCKGLVELIVLNIGLQAGILNNAVFAMFVLMALVTTFATTPLTLWVYPAHLRGPLRERRLGSLSSAENAADATTTSPIEKPVVESPQPTSHLPAMLSPTGTTRTVRSVISVPEHLAQFRADRPNV